MLAVGIGWWGTWHGSKLGRVLPESKRISTEVHISLGLCKAERERAAGYRARLPVWEREIESERRERDKRLHSRFGLHKHKHPAGYIGGGDEVGS